MEQRGTAALKEAQASGSSCCRVLRATSGNIWKDETLVQLTNTPGGKGLQEKRFLSFCFTHKGTKNSLQKVVVIKACVMHNSPSTHYTGQK